MKNFSLFTLLLTISLIGLGVGCQDNSENDSVLFVEFEFQLLEETGDPSTVFQEGQNFRFSFVIRNQSSKNIGYSPSFIDDDFFRVYRIDTSEGEVPMGKPYSSVFCEYIGSQFVILPDDELHLEIPWIPTADFCCPPFCKVNNNSPLSKGNYKTFIEGSFNFDYEGESKTITKRFEILFTIN
jgi:hypothetical protein